MEYLTMIVFWMVTLSCLQAGHLPIEDSQISFMRTSIECPSDSKFYVPKNVMEPCITTALDCIKRELNGTVRAECTNVEGRPDIDQAVAFFEGVIKGRTSCGHAMSNSRKCACERWSGAPFSSFLDKVEALLQRLNTNA